MMKAVTDSNFHGSKCVVTGAAGFIGSHLVDRLLTEGALVTGVDNLLTGRKQNLTDAEAKPGFTFLESDVSQPEYLDQVGEFDYFFHLASPASPPFFQTYPLEIISVNTDGNRHALAHIKSHNPQARYLFAGTSEAYGDPLVHPQPETYWGNVNPNGVRSCYDESKRLGETICGVYEREFNLDVRIIRIFNTYGPRINPEDKRAVPEFVRLALLNQPLTIFGDGAQTRSFCYISDLINGILAVMSSDQARGETFNFGNPDERSVLEVADQINDLTGNQAGTENLPLPEDDPARRQPDITKAERILGWQPEVDFETGLKLTIAHFEQTEQLS